MSTLVFVLGTVLAVSRSSVESQPGWWDAQVAKSLGRAPARRELWEKVLAGTPENQRPGMAYLVTYLPQRDLEGLTPEALARNCALAYEARKSVPWGQRLPEEIFLDAVLPHACTTEPRDPMRAEFLKRYLGLVKDCQSPASAACRVNEHLFRDYKVTYNTRRLRTDQCSRESIAQGVATCTGLSLMLVEACRSVGIPARVATIASWPGRGGNHTWVEVWDGAWHFLGAAEPDPAGLDHAWFVGDAGRAIEDSPRNAIWAITYRTTGQNAPLAWAPGSVVPGENVTRRYMSKTSAPAPIPRLLVEARRGGQRIEADIEAIDRKSGQSVLTGRSLGPSADINHHLEVALSDSRSVVIVARADSRVASCVATVAGDTVVRVDLDKDSYAGISELLRIRFGADLEASKRVGKALARIPWDQSFRVRAWEAFKGSPRHGSIRKELDQKTVSTDDRTSPYRYREVGTRPPGGWPLVIAMHGGGGAPKAVNDSQWKSMFERYYRDHPEAGGYIYLALRAPNDTWNGFYDDAICPLIIRLIEQFTLFKDVDPDRVYTLGASHGGYGAFVIGPKIPDRFAAVHASAAAPTDGETQGENLRNLRFSFMVGERDTAYGRAERCQKFARVVEGWRAERGGYPGGLEWKPGVGHSVPDRDKIAELLGTRRDAHPPHLIWVQSDTVLKHFYWIEAATPVDGGRVEATVRDNSIRLSTRNQGKIALWLDAPLVDLTRPVEIERDGKTIRCTPDANLETFCRGMDERGDPSLAAPARVEVP